MFKNASPKAIALGGITFAGLGIIGIGVEVTKGVTFEIQKARAATTAALAEVEKSKAAMQSALAEMSKAGADKLRADNELLAARITQQGAILVGRLMSTAQVVAADKNATGLVTATGVDKYVENNIYDGFTSHFVEPAKAIHNFNGQISRLKREAQSGIDGKSRRFLTEAERADRLAQVRILEQEKEIESDTSAADINDIVKVMSKGVSGLMGSMDAFYPSSSVVPVTRRIIQEQ